MVLRRIARVTYLLAFVVVQQFTAVFDQYPLLGILGLLGVAVVGIDAAVCAKRRWGTLEDALGGDASSEN